eukprot:9280233-Alexandrium_andersonii.AAC.1
MGNIAGSKASACTKGSRVLNQARGGIIAAECNGAVGTTKSRLQRTTAAAAVIMDVRRLESAAAATRDRGSGALRSSRTKASKVRSSAGMKAAAPRRRASAASAARGRRVCARKGGRAP